MHSRRSRRTHSTNINYNESSPEPQPCLEYRKPNNRELAVNTIHFPELHHKEQRYFLKVTYWNDKGAEYLPIQFAVNKFSKLKSWLLSETVNKSAQMTPHLEQAIHDAIIVDVEPKYNVDTICMLINDELHSIISYVAITAINPNRNCEITDADDLLLYYVKHVDLRCDKFKVFSKRSGKEFDLERPGGWVTEAELYPISNVWIKAQLHYYKALAESNALQIQNVSMAFVHTVSILIDFIAIKVRASLRLRNERKVISTSFHCGKPIIDNILHNKFREIKGLNWKQTFFTKSSSTYYLFNMEQMEEIVGEDNVSRDFTLDGKEVNPQDDGNIYDEFMLLFDSLL